MNKRVLARAGSLLGALALSTGVLVGIAAPAQAASLGEVEISQSSGLVTDTPIFASGSSAPCPQGYGENANLRVGRPGGPYSNLAPVLGGGGFDDPGELPDGKITVNPNRSFQTALGAAPGNGEWWVVMECYSLTEGRHTDEFRTSIVVSGNTWRIPIAENTTTSLAVNPASPVEQGTEVTLTATVAAETSPASAIAGTVEFRRGASVLGTAPVTDGTATFSTTALPVGTFGLSAAFVPADATAFKASTSTAVSYQVTATAGAITAPVEIIADVAPGAFTLVVASPAAELAGGTVGGTAAGSLPTATVTDLRGTNVGWDVTGQLEDFTLGTDTIPNSNLSWTPAAAKTGGSGAVTAGAAADLGEARTLCSAVSGSSAGEFTCDAGLSLTIPDNVPPGEYTATLTLTLA
ncbi:Ig-like domain repeat protein [Micromonospora sp. WMMD1082]|uniref:Ig-like domain repeat protein n=1 Tax=Micromonospora sp. WMMD1082 TaxID=3016104 RepID=UPI0024166447|nr:Ig-like domain repeat protein [Micromonospora sp. WMMD1082]MDG4795286.1 Ig-like domain repeat protein [Micromonospora sp. WMMD1082]